MSDFYENSNPHSSYHKAAVELCKLQIFAIWECFLRALKSKNSVNCNLRDSQICNLLGLRVLSKRKKFPFESSLISMNYWLGDVTSLVNVWLIFDFQKYVNWLCVFLEVNPCFQRAHVFCMDLQPAADPYNVVCRLGLVIFIISKNLRF